MTKNEFLAYLHEGDFKQLFLECLWNNPTSAVPFRIAIGGGAGSSRPAAEIEVREAAQKGLKVFVAKVDKMPDSSTRRLIDTKLRKLCHEYFVVFVSTSEPFHHLWSVPVKAVDKRQLVSIEYASDDQAAFLVEKMNMISFSPDETPTIVDVAQRVNAAFLVNATEVTKKFYQGFKKQHDMFVKGIENVADAANREWYASVMLNRLMFCYFIQKKRFLNFDENYLGNKLKETQDRKGKDKFYGSFYRSFLKQLFSDGLDKPHKERSDYFIRKYGRIPYLNGGMFSMHRIEKENKDIDIPDKVFEQLFAFFDQWRWHLDNRITASGRDINPDVLGYIFEQYINDRAQMGAYYTKEDITEYIGRNTIVPWIWIKAVGKGDISPFLAGGAVPGAPQADRYIFPAMRKGIDLPLPPEIEKGVAVEPQATLRKRRAEWNKPADAKYALPTEIWRETVARRQRCEEIREKIAKGEIKDIHDFITYNLDIRTFAEDVIRNTSDHKLVLHFYKAIREVTILDPTCGSGAFLFAALNILEPLYEACLDRMEEFNGRNQNLFKDELAEIAGKFRSNRQYFIYKNIILRNLYGVDIMPEATEIARLRLFLKMVAVVDVDEYDENLGLDPLPDIDFNIRCGNTLVGYASEKEIEDALVNGDMFAYAELKGKIDAGLEKASMAFDFFRREQLNLLGDHQQLVDAKKDINERLAAIRNLLDDHLYASSGGLKKKDAWLRDTQPFHWYTEFYPIMHGRGGFDVIIGNPPYVEYSKVKDYKIQGYKTECCGNLYAFVIERSCHILNLLGYWGMIVPSASVCTPRMVPLGNEIRNSSKARWVSVWDERPAKLFDGVDQQLAIQLFARNSYRKALCMSNMRHWSTKERPIIFETVRYCEINTNTIHQGIAPKFCTGIEASIHERLTFDSIALSNFCNNSETGKVYYRTAGGRYWRLIKSFPSYFRSEKGATVSSKEKYILVHDDYRHSIVAELVSTLFYWYWRSYSDCRDLTNREMQEFPVVNFSGSKHLVAGLKQLAIRYEQCLQKYKERIVVNSLRSGQIQQDVYHVSCAKPIIDEIDELLAKHYGFTEEELDFIINYDIKYRMGDRLNEEE